MACCSLFSLPSGKSQPRSRANLRRLRIEFEAPSGCSSVDAFYEGIHGRTDRVRWASEGENAVHVQIRIRLVRAGAKIKGELRLSDQEGEKETRKVNGTTCDEVVEALSLTVTLALDPSALLVATKQSSPGRNAPDASANTPTTPPTSPAQGQTSPRNGQGLPTASNHRAAAAASPSKTQVELGAQMEAQTVVSPGISWGGAVSSRVIMPSPAIGQWSIGMMLMHVQNDFLRTADRGAFGLTALGLDLCPLRRHAFAWLDLEMGAVVSGGWLRASGLAVDHPDSVSRSWWATGLRGSASVALIASLRLELNVGVSVPIIRREFVTSEPDQHVGVTPWVTVQGGLGLAYRL